jgi:Mg2+ and Co2+ transporter CorA
MADTSDDPKDYFGVLNPLFKIMAQDVLSLIKWLHTSLDSIDVGILNENKMEENMSLWRELITRAQLELPELRRSMLSFFSFFHVLNSGMEAISSEASDNLDDDISRGFQDVSKRIDEILQRLSTASSSLNSHMALLDSRRSSAEAQAVTKLTELAFSSFL